MRVLITGVTGQDGSYLAEQLHADGHQVYGLVRGQNNPRRDWLTNLVPGIELLDGDLLDPGSLLAAVEASEPDQVFNLGAITAPGMSWGQPTLTAEVTGLGTLRLLEAVRRAAPTARVVQAASIATHGPYGAAKVFARNIVGDYRTAYGLHVSCAVMVGHHSPRRGPEFFTRKVTRAVGAIAAGRQQRLQLGWLGRRQDFGWAPNFVDGLRRVAAAEPGDYVLATGDPRPCREWVAVAFAAAGLDWNEHVDIDEALSQPTDVPELTGDPDPRLRWSPNMDFHALAAWMVGADRISMDLL